MSIAIHDLSAYQLYRLQSLHPAFSSDWRQIIQDIVILLDKESQNSVYRRILLPRGIIFDEEHKRFIYQPPSYPQDFLNVQYTTNQKIKQIVQKMQQLLAMSVADGGMQTKVNIKECADRIEGLLSVIDQMDLQGNANDIKILQEVRQEFLYRLLTWIDDVEFDVIGGMRQLTKEQLIVYFKEVFVKQQIQGWDFRYLDSSDIESLQMTHFPKKLAQWSKERSLFIVESKDYWFLIGQSSNSKQNPFSFGRFLHEDGDGQYVYITHVVVPRRQLNNIETARHIAYQVSRIYTLDRGIGEEVLNFVRQAKNYQEKQIKPLLKSPLVNDGSGAENIVNQRMADYEKQLSLFVLNKLPKVLDNAVFNHDDMDYLYYQLGNFIKECCYGINDFRLQPLAEYAICSQTMAIRLESYNILIQKNKHILSNTQLSIEEKAQKLTKTYADVVEMFEALDAQMSELKELKEQIKATLKQPPKKTLWQRLGLGHTAPQYSLEELDDMHHQLSENFFIDIIKLAKQQPNLMIYAEFESGQTYHNDYRHYVFLYGEKAVDRLPKVIRLPENRQLFDVDALSVDIFDDVFKQNQEW